MSKLDFLRTTLKTNYPEIPLEERFAHADTLFNGRLWSEARTEYAQLLPQLSGADLERAELRILECGVVAWRRTFRPCCACKLPTLMSTRRDFSLSPSITATSQPDSQMPAAVESAASRAPQSSWAEQALFLAGNYYWVQLDRDRASGYYKRVADNFATSPDAVPHSGASLGPLF